MASENYNNLIKDDETVRLTLLVNVCRMMVTRGYMDKKKYTSSNDSKEKKIHGYFDNDTINNDLFLPFIEKRTDNNIYTIPLDVHFKGEREKKSEKSEFDGSSLIVRIIPQKVTDVDNSPIFNDFLKSYEKFHKIVIFDGMAEKVYNSIRRKKNLEAFEKDSMMIDYMSYIGAPVECSIVLNDDIKHILNPKIAKIYENDPLARYYGAKIDDILRIVRASVNNSNEVSYRKVIEPKPLFK